MSIEIGSEFSDVVSVVNIVKNLELRKNNSNNIQTLESAHVTQAVQAVHALDRGISYIRSEWADAAEDLEVIHAVSPLKLNDELIEFQKDPDYDDDGFEGFDAGYDSLLPYDYETEVVDALNLNAQIAAYAAESWEFVSITDNIILFQKPKWEA
ncbi:hypothetical protein LJC08_03425 [Methanimicrococcus sp. OttesenSCG-928-J09]|nr:hypothetical protein [Methanimicrococcus sp. OttesenSCG-928-J09]